MEMIYQNTTAIAILFINFIASISYFIIYSKDRWKSAFSRLPVILQKIYVAFFVLPLFTAPFFSVSKFGDSNAILLITGIVVAVVGFSIIVLSFLKIGVVPSIKSDGKLSTTGTYKIVRHPIYFGTIAAQLGLIFATRALISLIYLPVSILLYYLMASLEEKDLVNVFGNQYIRFREKTRGKVIPFIF
ncbi:MAG: isoprenylcysteine carboxylmethyltransferase family protein [Chloroflexi bacterium]|nr:isoprenylcysteine carboxylmethyltransferase family protein [Chloroflexota bacterium]